jgi:hypothetical protein
MLPESFHFHSLFVSPLWELSLSRTRATMVFLKSEPKWNILRADPRFGDLLARIGFMP